MQRSTTGIVLLLTLATVAGQVYSADVKTDDAYGDAFLQYRPYVVSGAKAEPKPAEKKPSVLLQQDQQKVTVKWLQENYPKLEMRAIDNPTDAQVSAMLYVKRIILDKSQRFSSKVMEVTNQDPLLNENNRIPYASSGAQSIRNANHEAQGQAVRELAGEGGLIVFVDGACRFCVMQMPIIRALYKNYGVEALVVSLDGSRPKGYDGPITKDNGLFRKLDLKLTPSVVYVHKPKAYDGAVDPNKYHIVAQGFYAQDELVKQIAFAGHNTNILSKTTMADLSVWDRGVATTTDLNKLELDLNKPETFKDKLQPILKKQY